MATDLRESTAVTGSAGQVSASTESQWSRWVATHVVGAAVVIGLVATQMATIVGYYFRGIGLPQTPWPLFNGALGAPAEKFGNAASFFVGQSIHMVDGVVFTLLFVLLLRDRIPLPNSGSAGVLKGMIYGVVLSLISMGFLVPYVYAPRSGYGLFSFDTPSGWKLPLSILLFHLVYGYFLGKLYSTEDA